MTKTKKKPETDQTTISINKDIHSFTQYFYAVVNQKVPDATQYAASYKILKTLMLPDETHARVYTLEDMQKVVVKLLESDIIPTIGLFHYPSLIAQIVDDSPLLDNTLKTIKRSQVEKGIYTDMELERMKPNDW